MKNSLLLFFLFIGLLSSVGKQTIFGNRTILQTEKVKVMTVDSTDEYYVFNTDSKSKEYSIVISEKKNLVACRHFGKFILIDSVKQSSNIKMGSGLTGIGFDGLTIDKVKVKNAGVLTKLSLIAKLSVISLSCALGGRGIV